MKTALSLSLTLFFAVSSAFADSQEKILDCKATSLLDGNTLTNDIQIRKNPDGSLLSIIKQITNGKESPHTQYKNVYFSEGLIREGLGGTPDHDNDADTGSFSEGELLIKHAISLTDAMPGSGIADAGFDLRLARFAKVYRLDKMTKFGTAAVVVAFDQSGKKIGSFLGGFLVNKCE